jgi:toxin ParE1/3/4
MIVAWTTDADRDLDEIWNYIAEDNPAVADRISHRLYMAALQLADFPRLGRSGRKRRTREMVVSGTAYIFIYQIASDRIEILRVYDSRRRWPPTS